MTERSVRAAFYELRQHERARHQKAMSRIAAAERVAMGLTPSPQAASKLDLKPGDRVMLTSSSGRCHQVTVSRAPFLHRHGTKYLVTLEGMRGSYGLERIIPCGQ